jgi:hypothetical protein
MVVFLKKVSGGNGGITASYFVAAQHGWKYRANCRQIKRYLLRCNKLGEISQNLLI